jgi:hypothetical protein
VTELTELMRLNPNLLFALYRDPAIVAWNRLETRPRSNDFSRSLRAEVRDPLWLLTRQWQMGELEAEDTGSPVDARLTTQRLRIDRVQLGGGAPRLYDDTVPLEAVVERERIPFTHALRVQAGQVLIALLPAGLRATYRQRCRTAFPFPQHDEDAYRGQVDGLNLYLATRRAAFDGEAALAAARDGTFAAKVGVDPGDVADVADATEAFGLWFERQYLQPAPADPPVWDHSRLCYTLQAAAPAGDGAQAVLRADRYRDGHLDWDSFELDQNSAGLPVHAPAPPPAPPERDSISFLPVAASFQGMPNPRFWEMEERKVNFGALNATTTDQLLLVFAELGLIYGNDWFVIPYKLPVNTLSQVESLVVTDVFGDRTLVPAADEGDEANWRRWSLFDLSNAGEPGTYNRQFLLLSALGEAGESEPVERVQFVRDEVANLVWAIEEVIPDATGRGLDGYAAADKTGVLPEPIDHSPAAIRYLLGTTVPENWIPFLPVQRPGSAQDIALQRAAMPKLGQPPRDIVSAKGVLLNEPALPWFVDEEEVSGAGTVVTRAYQRVRWYDGRTYLWIGRRAETGRGAGSSGLRFDQIDPTT